MSAEICAWVKFWPEMRTVPLSVVPVEPESVAVLLLFELPQAVSSAALAATTPTTRRRVCMGTSLTFCVPRRLRRACPVPPFVPGRGRPSSANGIRGATPGRGGPDFSSLTIRVHRALHERTADLEQEG